MKYALVPLFCFSSVLFGQTLTVNKYVCTGDSYTANVPSPDKINPAINPQCKPASAVNMGDDVVFFIVITNLKAPITPITLTDKLPTFFVAKDVLCAGFNGGVCGPPATLTGNSLVLSGLTVPDVNNGVVVIEVRGYFTKNGSDEANFTNTATGTPHTPPDVGDKNNNIAPKLVVVDAPKLKWDLAVDKTFTPKGTKGFHVTITVKNNGTEKVFVDKLLTLQDRLKTLTTPIPLLNFTLANFTCLPAADPGCPTNLPAGVVQRTLDTSNQLNYLLFAPWNGPPLNPSFIGPGTTISIDFDIEFAPICGSGSVQFSNEAYLALAQTGAFIQDADPSNDHPIRGPLTLTYTGDACPGGSKTVLSPANPSAVQWSIGASGDEVTYQVAITNPTSSPVTVDVLDQISKPQGTPPFTWQLTSGPTCNPATACGTPTILTPTFTVLDTFSHTIFKVPVTAPPGGATVTFKVRFTPLEYCQTTTGNDTITNSANLSIGGSTVKNTAVSIIMVPLPKCELVVTKELLSGNTQVEFGKPITYKVTYTNGSATQPVTIRTLRDAVSVDSFSYGSVPIAIDPSSTCTASFGATVKPAASVVASWQTRGWSGTPIINLAAPVVFPPKGTIACTITLTATPSVSGGCQSDGTPKLVNAAFFDPEILPLGGSQQPAYYKELTLPLPLCRTITIQKTVDNQTPSPGDVVTFTIIVHNAGAGAVSGIVLTDPLPAGFIIQSATCTPCTIQPAWNTKQELSLSLDPLSGGGDVKILVQAKAPAVGGSYQNTAKIDLPNQGNVYNAGGNTSNPAQVQVQTPKLTKTFDPKTVKPGDQLSLIFTITNPVGKPFSGMQFTDNLPPGMEIVQVDAAGTTCSGNVKLSLDKRSFTFSAGTIGANSCQIKILVRANGCSVVNRWSDNPANSNIVDIINLDPTGVLATLTVEPCAPPTGFIEICKASSTTNPVTGDFAFTLTVGTGAPLQVVVPTGACTAPIEVTPGTVTITELLGISVGVSGITASGSNPISLLPEDRLMTSDLPARTATVTVVAGDVSTVTVATFTNSKVPTGYLEICKELMQGSTATGNFSFNVPGAPENPYVVPAGACTGPIPVQAGSVTITELPRGGFQLADVSTLPFDRLLTKNTAGGSATVTVVGGDVSTQTAVIFHNEPAPGQLKICKIAGPGIAQGQSFTISANGVSFTVPAGPPSQGGYCVLDGTFPVGTLVTVQETIPLPDELINIAVNPPDRIGGAPNLANGTVPVRIGTGFTEVTFTNAARTLGPVGQLQICKIAGPGVTAGTNFTFKATGQEGTQTYTVPAGASQGGYCVFDGRFPIGTSLTVAEVVPAGGEVADIKVAPAGRNSPPTANSVVLVLGTGLTTVTFTDIAFPAIATTALLSGQSGVPFYQKLAATGGTPPYLWQIEEGTLPAGLVLNPQTGEISGIPESDVESIPVTFKVTDSGSRTATGSFTLDRSTERVGARPRRRWRTF